MEKTIVNHEAYCNLDKFLSGMLFKSSKYEEEYFKYKKTEGSLGRVTSESGSYTGYVTQINEEGICVTTCGMAVEHKEVVLFNEMKFKK